MRLLCQLYFVSPMPGTMHYHKPHLHYHFSTWFGPDVARPDKKQVNRARHRARFDEAESLNARWAWPGWSSASVLYVSASHCIRIPGSEQFIGIQRVQLFLIFPVQNTSLQFRYQQYSSYPLFNAAMSITTNLCDIATSMISSSTKMLLCICMCK